MVHFRKVHQFDRFCQEVRGFSYHGVLIQDAVHERSIYRGRDDTIPNLAEAVQ